LQPVASRSRVAAVGNQFALTVSSHFTKSNVDAFEFVRKTNDTASLICA
jgi:hypothetical protein